MNLENLKALAESLPDTVKSNALDLVTRMGEVVEGVGDTPVSWRPAFLKLIQGTSDRTKLQKNTGIGDIVIGETKVESPLSIFPLRLWEARQWWSPDQNEAKMLCSSPDAKVGYIGLDCRTCPHSQYNEETRKSECNKLKSVLAITEDLSEIVLIHFAKTNFLIGKEWETQMKKAGVSPYRRKYGLGSKPSAAYKGIENYDIKTLDTKERVTPDEYLPFLAELFKLVGDERQEALVKFYEFVKDRRAAGNVGQIGNTADSEVKLLESDPEVTGSGESGMASKYEV